MADHDWRKKRDWRIAKHYEKVTVQELPQNQRQELWKLKNEALTNDMLSDLKKRLDKGEKFQFTKIYGKGYILLFKHVEYKLEYNPKYKRVSITKTPLLTQRGSVWATARPEKVQEYGLGKHNLTEYLQATTAA